MASTMRRPAATPWRFAYWRIAPASMMPGRSFCSNTQRLLDGAGCEQRLLRVHAPVALAHAGGFAAEVDALQESRRAVIVEAEAGGRGQQGHVARRCELAQHAREPDGDGRIVDQRIGRQQSAAALEILLRDDDGEARARGGLRGEQARRAAADDQQVAMRIDRVVTGGVAFARRLREAGRATDEAFPEIPGGPHEGLVVEAGVPESRRAIERCGRSRG